MNRRVELSESDWVKLILGSAFLFGVLVRFLPGLMAGFPLNDGGMFLSMTRDLQQSAYVLPKFASYNLSDIPFTYPPFGFYFARVFSDLFHVPELDVLRWIPPFVNSISILAFYLLAKEILKNRVLGAVASALYAVTPGAFGWFVMGGGLTRSFGSLFLLLTVFFIWRLFLTGERRFIGWSILLGGLTVLSHPEAGVHAAATCILVWIFCGRSLRSFLSACWVGVGVLLFTSPWWGTLLVYHGWAPFLSALRTGSLSNSFWVSFLQFLSGDGVVPVLLVLRVLGLVWGIWRKQFFLIVWVIAPYLVAARSAQNIAVYPMTILTVAVFSEVFLYILARFRSSKLQLEELYKHTAYNVSIFILLIVLFVDSGLYGFRLVGNSLQRSDLQVMEWVSSNTPVDASVLSLTGIVYPEIDPFVEWLPALTGRYSPVTIQGLEWTLGDQFFRRYKELAQLQSCASEVCVSDWSQQTGLRFDYVLIRGTDTAEALFHSFQDSDAYQQVYESEDVAVFKRLSK